MAVAKEYTINDPEDLLQCPYESAHMIRAKRMQCHLMKCRKQHPCSEFVRCPYNATHEVYNVELRYHMATCDDRQRVQGKIAQEHLEKDTELKGCIETPGYRPLDVWGESWEQDIPSLPLGIPPTPAARPHMQEAKREVAQTEGLTGRQLRQLYLRRKAEEAQRKDAEQRKEGPGEKLRVPRQPSQSLAIHQQRQQQQHEDIYQKALKGQENRAIAFGRGRGLLQGVKPAQVGAAQLPTGPDAAASSPMGRGQGHISTSAGRGAGFNSQTVGIQNIGSVHMQGGTWNSLSSQMALMTTEGREGGAGVERSLVNAEGDMSSVPSANGLKNTGLGPQGKGRASAQNFINMAGRSLGPRPPEPGQARGTVPFYQSASQPNPLYPTMQQTGAGWGRGASPAVASFSTEHNSWDHTGMPATTASACHEPSLYVKDNSDNDDDNEQFQDAMSWVGGGYGDDLQTTPTFTSSNTSLPANPQLVGSWAEHMEQAFPVPSASTSSVSDSTSSDSDFQGSGAVMKKEDAVKELRRIRKKLRQIDNLDLKMHEGQRLEPAEEAKWRNKPTLIAQATSLQQTFGLQCLNQGKSWARLWTGSA